MMRNFCFGVVLFLVCFNCNDGDLINVEFDFDDTFTNVECGPLIIYKINNTNNESLAISLSDVSISDLFNFDEILNNVRDTIVIQATINGIGNRFNYRTYSSEVTGSQLFCNPIPPSDITVIREEESLSGTVIITIIAEDDDNDGVPAEFEDVNGNGNLFDDDTDGDGIPNFLDVDDDGDNVLTRDELNVNGRDENFGNNPLDTDGDGVLDYLDTDDDGDGALTRDEENFVQDQNPRNDITDITVGPDYLNPNVSTVVPAVAFRAHTVTRTFTITIEVNNIQFSFLNQSSFDFGENVSSESIQKFPIFN